MKSETNPCREIDELNDYFEHYELIKAITNEIIIDYNKAALTGVPIGEKPPLLAHCRSGKQHTRFEIALGNQSLAAGGGLVSFTYYRDMCAIGYFEITSPVSKFRPETTLCVADPTFIDQAVEFVKRMAEYNQRYKKPLNPLTAEIIKRYK